MNIHRHANASNCPQKLVAASPVATPSMNKVAVTIDEAGYDLISNPQYTNRKKEPVRQLRETELGPTHAEY